MNDRTRHAERNRQRADALDRAIERFHHDQRYDLGRAPFDPASTRSRVACPIHGTPARFEMNGGAAQVWFCCDVLLSLVRELSDGDEAR